MPKISTLLLFLFNIITFNSFSQEKFTLCATISDTKNKETLIGVNMYFIIVKVIISINENSFYSVTLPLNTPL